MASDGGGRQGFANVRLSVGDENDNTPEFVYNEYKAVIHSNISANTTFLKVIYLLYKTILIYIN